MKKEDLLLVERCKQGDQIAYGQLGRKYQNSVYNLCRKMVRNPEEARDLAQEAFVKTFAALDRYNPFYAFSSWLFKITSNPVHRPHPQAAYAVAVDRRPDGR